MENTGPEQDPWLKSGERSEEKSLIKMIRRNFFYGLIVILPIVATFWLVIFMIQLISGPLSSLFGRKIPVLVSFFLTILFITVLGVATKNIIGQSILGYFERLLVRIPFINTIYKSSKQIVQAFSFDNKNFLGAVLLEYPRTGVWVLGFLTKENTAGLKDLDGKDVTAGKCAVFIPTTPNPTSGVFVFVSQEDIVRLSISIETSVKLIMSAGLIGLDEETAIMKSPDRRRRKSRKENPEKESV